MPFIFLSSIRWLAIPVAFIQRSCQFSDEIHELRSVWFGRRLVTEFPPIPGAILGVILVHETPPLGSRFKPGLLR